MSDRDKDIAKLVNGVFDEWQRKVRRVVAAAQKSHQVRTDLSADIISRHIIMTIEGGIMLARLKKSEKHLRATLISLKALLGLKK